MTNQDTRRIHLITQRGQPYGSTRKCCERCGAYGTIQSGTDIATDDPELWGNSPHNCYKQKDD
jgi:hypothetical protein